MQVFIPNSKEFGTTGRNAVYNTIKDYLSKHVTQYYDYINTNDTIVELSTDD